MGYGGVRNKRIRKFERSLEMKQNAKRHKNNLESMHFSHDEAITIGLTEKELFVDRLNKGIKLGLDAILIVKIFDLIIQNSRQAQK